MADGTFHIGWFKGGMAHGFGIGNAYTNGMGIRNGIFKENVFVNDNNTSLDKSILKPKRFTL